MVLLLLDSQCFICLYLRYLIRLRMQVKNIAMEILDFYDSHKMITEERVHGAMNKLGLKQ